MNSTTAAAAAAAVVYHTSLEGDMTGKRKRQCAALYSTVRLRRRAALYAVLCRTMRCGAVRSVRCCTAGFSAALCGVPLKCGREL